MRGPGFAVQRRLQAGSVHCLFLNMLDKMRACRCKTALTIYRLSCILGREASTREHVRDVSCGSYTGIRMTELRFANPLYPTDY